MQLEKNRPIECNFSKPTQYVRMHYKLSFWKVIYNHASNQDKKQERKYLQKGQLEKTFKRRKRPEMISAIFEPG